MIAPPHAFTFLELPLAVLVALLTLLAAQKDWGRGLLLSVLSVGGIALVGLLAGEDLGQTLAVSAIAFLFASGLPRGTEATLVASRRTVCWLAIAATSLLLSIALDYLNANQALPGLAGPIGGLFVVGVAVVLGAFPFGFWLLSLAEESPDFASVLVGSLGLDVALLGAGMLSNSPWRVGNLATGPLLAVFGLSSVVAALSAIGEKQPARVFAYLISADAALQVGGLVAAPAALPVAPVVFALCAHALAGSVGLAILAYTRPRLSGLFCERPALAVALIVSASSLVGLPLTAGFSSRLAIDHLANSPTLLYSAFAALVTVLGTIAIVRSYGSVFLRIDESHSMVGAFDYVAGFATAIILLAGLAPGLVFSLMK